MNYLALKMRKNSTVFIKPFRAGCANCQAQPKPKPNFEAEMAIKYNQSNINDVHMKGSFKAHSLVRFAPFLPSSAQAPAGLSWL